MLFSGGTTGIPKAAVCTHHALLISGMQISSWLKDLLVRWDDKVMLNLPLFHIYGLAGVLLTALAGRNPLVVIPNPRDIEDLPASIEKMRPALLPGVPMLFNAVLNHRKVRSGRADLSCLKVSISGAAPLLLEIKDRYENLSGGRTVEGYALTESVMAAVITPVEGMYKRGPVGIPLPEVEIRITDVDTGVGDLPPGEVGEILPGAPQLMRQYWQKPEETENRIRGGLLYI